METARAAQAGQRLEVVCRWLLDEPDAAAHVDKIADGPGRGPLTEEQMDLDGALVFACLLYLTGHQESAWKYRTGSPWRDLPDKLGSFQTAHKRLIRWAVGAVGAVTHRHTGTPDGRALLPQGAPCRAPVATARAASCSV